MLLFETTKNAVIAARLRVFSELLTVNVNLRLSMAGGCIYTLITAEDTSVLRAATSNDESGHDGHV